MAGEASYLEKLLRLKDRVAVVTGGMGQLGTQYVGALAAAGARVAVYDLKEEPNPVLKRLAQSYPVRFFPVDITDRRGLEKATDELEAAWGAPGILINNAAIDFPPQPAGGKSEDSSLSQWERVLKVNLTGVFLCCQVVGERMAKAGGGSIINISSVYGLVS